MSEIIGLWDRLAREGKVIKSAPISFTVVCIACFLICLSMFSGDLVLKNETIKSYQQRLESVISTSKSGQLVIYKNNPNDEKLKPEDTQKPAQAYDENGEKGTYSWSIKDQTWK